MKKVDGTQIIINFFMTYKLCRTFFNGVEVKVPVADALCGRPQLPMDLVASDRMRLAGCVLVVETIYGVALGHGGLKGVHGGHVGPIKFCSADEICWMIM